MTAIVFSTGQRVELSDRMIVGRSPAVHPGEECVVVSVIDPSRSVSKTHFEIGRDESGVWIMDCHSMNGTLLVGADSQRALDPRRRVHFDPSQLIRFGRLSAQLESGQHSTGPYSSSHLDETN
ncbi:FHA domain-containing protein [Humidisolicoccus flavus]|uniref:FHA domain-containing protein n=1 Tax=Humidisolicoccus flavus TaxID=3111414 RepID=UPI0032442695